MTMFSTFIAKVVGEKRQWREYKARARQLPASYRTALDALERYLNYFGTGGDGTALYGGPRRPVRAERGERNPDPRHRRERPRGVHRDVRP
jgi:hypothetical protein